MGMHTSGSEIGVLQANMAVTGEAVFSHSTVSMRDDHVWRAITSVRHSPASYCFSFMNSLSR